MTTTYYPASPTRSNRKLTALTPSYQFRAFLAVLAIVLFFVLYLILVASLGYLVYYAISYDMGNINKLTILMKVGAIAGAIMLFAFTLKFIFKLKNHKPKNRIKLDKKEYQDLWAFVNQICKETGAPRPKSIYVDPDVNAYVAYSNMWLSLFLPVRKELTIGMGLVDCLNLSEFKAVISHEFGHFAQRSMKIGSYIISANTIIHDMIFARDKWDDLLESWRGSDIRLSAAAWVITPIIWIIRQVLSLFYQFLNIMYSSLSREMEFNADKVAVSTSGSEAIVSALWKLDGGSAHWSKTINHAYLASQKQNFVKNMYQHNAMALERASISQQQTLAALPEDPRGGTHYFASSELSKVGMYASHPPNDMRENNAKTPYVSCEEDQRSPWVLFGNKEPLQEAMTAMIYQQYLDKQPIEFVDPQIFEDFIAAENAGNELLEEYQNTFENRFLQIPDISVLEKEAAALQGADASGLENLKLELNYLMKPVSELEQLMSKVQQIAQGTSTESTFSIQGTTYDKKNLQQGYEHLLQERERLFEESFKDWDRSLCGYHYALAKRLGKDHILLDRYLLHRAIEKIYRAVSGTKAGIYERVAKAQEQGEVDHGVINAIMHDIKGAIRALNEDMDALDGVKFVPLPNIDSVEDLKRAIVEGGRFKPESGKIFENGGFDKTMTVLENAIVHCQRIDQKSIGSILSLHKELQKGAM